MKLSLFSICLFTVFALCAGLALAETSPKESLDSLFHDSREFYLQENPVQATAEGDHRYNDRLSKAAPADFERRLEAYQKYLKRLDGIDREALTAEDKLNYDIFGRQMRDRVADLGFGYHLMPITNRSGFHVYFPEIHKRIPLGTVQDYENYISRLNAFKEYAEDHIALMRLGIKKGMVLPKVVLQGADEPIRAHIVDKPEDSLLWTPLKELPEDFSDADKKRLKESAREAISDSVVPGYEAFLDFMVKEYMPACRDSIAASKLPNGIAFYRHRVKHFTTLDVTPEEVHATGLSEVKRIRKEMEAVIKGVGFEGDFQAFVEHLRNDPRFYAETPEDLMKEVSYVLKKMDGKLPELFGKLPRMPYGIEPVPDYIAPKTTTAYYNGPTGDGTKAGIYYVNTYNLKARPLYEVEALSLHEAVPGHHLQIALQQELDIPAFRRFGGFTAFVEGWALYAESLGLEAGFYEDPYSDFGRLTYEMWRACRLVVDTGMHALGWERQRAIDYISNNTGLTMHNITTEVDRYISWPGQALAYKTGELKIKSLRKEAKKALGPDFDVRAFHDVVLGSGGVPLDVLEANVRAWVKDVKNSTKKQ